jgi:hypothetical protein
VAKAHGRELPVIEGGPSQEHNYVQEVRGLSVVTRRRLPHGHPHMAASHRSAKKQQYNIIV